MGGRARAGGRGMMYATQMPNLDPLYCFTSECVRTYIHHYMYTYVQTCVLSHVRSYVREYPRTHARKYVCAQVRTYVRTYVRAQARTYRGHACGHEPACGHGNGHAQAMAIAVVMTLERRNGGKKTLIIDFLTRPCLEAWLTFCYKFRSDGQLWKP